MILRIVHHYLEIGSLYEVPHVSNQVLAIRLMAGHRFAFHLRLIALLNIELGTT